VPLATASNFIQFINIEHILWVVDQALKMWISGVAPNASKADVTPGSDAGGGDEAMTTSSFYESI
jgi:hypothetical protein